MLTVKRISKIMAIIIVYIICAYGYLTEKGFVFTEKGTFFSNPAHAEENSFSKKIEGDVNVNIDERRMRIKGEKNAPLTIYAYSSMACSHCKEFHKFILPKLERDFISTGKARFVFVHFPLDVLSMKVAKFSYCLPEEKYYDFIDELYDKRDWQFAKDDNSINGYAEKYGMSAEDIKKCNEDTKLTSDILLTRNVAIEQLGIKGTPSFIIEGKDGKDLIVGSRNYDDLKEYLNTRLENLK